MDAERKARLKELRHTRDHALAELAERFIGRQQKLWDERIAERDRIWAEYDAAVAALPVPECAET